MPNTGSSSANQSSILDQPLSNDALYHPEAMHERACIYAQNPSEPQDYKRAKTLFKQALSLGHTRTLDALGYLYEQGLGGKVKMDRAIALYDQAITHGNIKSMVRRARIHTEQKEYSSAITLLEQAIALGCTIALSDRAEIHMKHKEYESAIPLLKQAIAHGNTAAMCLRAEIHIEHKEYSSAIDLLERAIIYSDTQAMCLRAQMHVNGYGDPANPKMAARLWRLAFESGHIDAMYQLKQYRHNQYNIFLDYHWLMITHKFDGAGLLITLEQEIFHEFLDSEINKKMIKNPQQGINLLNSMFDAFLDLPQNDFRRLILKTIIRTHEQLLEISPGQPDWSSFFLDTLYRINQPKLQYSDVRDWFFELLYILIDADKHEEHSSTLIADLLISMIPVRFLDLKDDFSTIDRTNPGANELYQIATILKNALNKTEQEITEEQVTVKDIARLLACYYQTDLAINFEQYFEQYIDQSPQTSEDEEKENLPTSPQASSSITFFSPLPAEQTPTHEPTRDLHNEAPGLLRDSSNFP